MSNEKYEEIKKRKYCCDKIKLSYWKHRIETTKLL